MNIFMNIKQDMPGAPLHGLTVEDLYGTTGAGVDLVVHHVLETLVVGGTKEDLGVQLAARVSVVQHLGTKAHNLHMPG